jgi:hypothetical protein
MTSKRRPVAPFIKHDTHQVEIRLVSTYKHHAKYHCVTCNKFVAWLSRKDTDTALKLGLAL